MQRPPLWQIQRCALLHGLLLQAGRERIAMLAPLCFLSYSVDTVLLSTALFLLTILPCGMFGNGWLTTKVVLLVIHIVLGSMPWKRGRTARIRTRCFIAARAIYATIIGIARAHHPRDSLLPWLG